MLLEIDAAIRPTSTAAPFAWPVLGRQQRAREGRVGGELARGVRNRRGAQGAQGDDRRRSRRPASPRDASEVERQLSHRRSASETGAYYRHPDAWEEQLDHAASRIDGSSNLRRASELVRDGKKALAKRDMRGVEDADARSCGSSLPADAEERERGYSSGVR